MAELANAVSALPGSDLTALDVAQLRGSQQPTASLSPEDEEKRLRARTLANWEPGYPTETVDYYEEFMQRHAEIRLDWIDLPNARSSDRDKFREATGVGILVDHNTGSNNIVSPLDDGTICIWDVAARSTAMPSGGGMLLGQSKPGLLTGRSDVGQNHTIMTEIGAVECVSIDNRAQKGYFAVQDLLQEVDLRTLQLTSTKRYPFFITTLSPCKDNMPLAIGTNQTIHLNDPRDSAFTSTSTSCGDGGELIAGPSSSHATLPQAGPLSVLPHAASSSLWIAGRFTSLLNYDVRHFPRLSGTIHSGARIASLTSLPYPLLPRSLDLVRNPTASTSDFQHARAAPGTTMLAAAEYKLKGSLEMYNLPDPAYANGIERHAYQNRQTASSSKLLSATPHGGRIVFSDGDGNVRWFERDGFTHVRSWNINAALPSPDPNNGDESANGIWPSSASEMPGQGDIVQKMFPIPSPTLTGGRPDLPSEPLGLWTGDGRLGVLNFGTQSPLGRDSQWHEALESQTMNAGERAKEDAARQFEKAMRRALERNADEVRFVRGLGMA